MFIVHLPSSVELGNRNLVEWLEELLWHLVQAHTLNLYFTFVHLYFTFVFHIDLYFHHLWLAQILGLAGHHSHPQFNLWSL